MGAISEKQNIACFMSQFATPIQDVVWGGEVPSTLIQKSDAPGTPFSPQLLYPSSAPLPPAALPPITANPTPPSEPKAAALSAAGAPQPPPPVAICGTTRSDVIMVVLFLLVITLLIFAVHLNSKVNSLQMMIAILASRQPK